MDDSKVLQRKIAAIMFSDMKGFSAKMGEDEETTFQLLSAHNKVMRDTIERYGGKVIKTIGDAFMSEFASPVNAVKCAYDVQGQFLRHNLNKADHEKIILRIGIHLGDILITENDIFGDGVNIAARLEPQAEPGGLCVSEIVYEFVKKQVKIPFRDGGALTLKNIKEPVHVYKAFPSLEEVSQEGPKQILQYAIIEKIHDSPVGIVYRAEDTKLKRTVALKHLNPNITANPEMKEKLLSEIRSVAEINHPNIVSVIDYGESGRDLYLVMEYIEGLDLKKWLVANKIKTPDIFVLAIQIADALTRLQQKGFNHLHIKADDILISKTGWLKILTLGLTKYLQETERKAIINASENIIYRAPEQINGDLGDAWSDVYSFGMVFYELCTEKVPFNREQLIASVHKGILPPVPSIQAIRPEIPKGLVECIMKCVKFDPQKRFQTMKDVLVDLRLQKQIFEGELSKEAEKEAKERLEKELSAEVLKKEFEKKSPVEVTVSPDNVKAFFTVSDPRYYENNSALDIVEMILRKGIVYNLNRDKISEVANKKETVQNLLISEGNPSRDGKDAQIDFKINIDAVKKLKLFKNDRIDLTTIAQWEFVKANQLIAKKIPLEKGVDGVDVYGKPLRAKDGKDYRFPKGKGLFVSEDGFSMYAEKNGIPYIDMDGRLNVYNLLVYSAEELAAINMMESPDEDIVINSNVVSPVTLETSQSIYVKGDVKSEGVFRSAEGDVVISGILSGRDELNKIVLECKGKLTSRRIEFADIKVGGTVEVGEGICNSDVSSLNGIRADEGSLCSGTFFAENWIRAKELGNGKGEETVVQVGSTENITSPEIEQFNNQINELRNLIKKLQPQLEEADKQRIRYERFKDIKKDLYLSVYNKYKQTLATIEKSQIEEKKRKQAIEMLKAKLYEKLIYQKKIYVTDTIHPGVTIKIMDMEYKITETYHKPQIIIRDNQLKILHEKI